MTGAADFVSLASLDISDGGVISTGGTISLLAGGQLSGTGKLDVSGSTWVLGGDFVKSSGTLTMSQTDLKLEGNRTLTSDEALSFVNLNLNYKTLTLGSSTSDLTVINAITIGQNTEGISTGDADLILNETQTISGEGSITSTGGIISLQEGGKLLGNGILDVSGSIWTLGDNFTKTSGTLTMLQTTLKLEDNSTLTSDEALNFVNLNLNNYTLTLGSKDSDLTIENAITINSSGEGILTGEADLILLSSLNMSHGLLGSTGGTWVLSKDFLKSGGTLTISQTNLALAGNSKLTSDVALSFVTLNLNNITLTLRSCTGYLTGENVISIDASTEGILTGGADLILLSSLNMSQGLLGSTGGTWVLSKDFLKSGGTLTISQTDLELKDSIKLTSDQALSFVFVTLNLNNFTLTLGSSTSDLTVENAITIDASTEGISTGEADLILDASLNISNGSVSSTGGIVSLSVGGQLSGTGILDVSGSSTVGTEGWVLGGDFEKDEGTLTISNTDLKLDKDLTLTSDEALRFVNLNLNDFTLIFGCLASDLTVENTITIDASTEGILTGGADLLLSALSLSAGDVTSTGGIVSLSGGGQLSGTGKLDVSGSTTVGTEGWVLGGDFVKSSGTLTISQTDLKLDRTRH